MYKTLTQITQGVINKIGLVSGTAVQSYTEPQIKSAVQDAFYMIFRKRFWEHLSDWYTFNLDGVSGYLTADLKNIVKSFDDIRDIYAGNNNNGSRIVKAVGNELLTNTQSATPLFYRPVQFSSDDFESRVIKIYPVTATGPVTFFARTCPDEFSDQSKIPFQSDMMEWAAAWMMLEVDGMNPGNAAKCQSMFQVTYNDIVSSMNDDVIGHGAGRYRDWRNQ